MLSRRCRVTLFSKTSFAAALLAPICFAGQNSRLPTFHRDIQPIVLKQCAGCHYPSGPGPFPLLTYAEVKSHARQIAAVTQTGYMPPWPPAATSGPFTDERHLTPEQIRLFRNWAAAGAPEGESGIHSPQAPAEEIEPRWRLGTPDLVLRTEKPFRLQADGPDIFWNFIFRPELKQGQYVRAIEIRPGNARLVHHANLLIDRAGSSARLEAVSGSGFGGMDLDLNRSPLDPVSHFLFWKPGSKPYEEPPGFAWRLNPGNLLVLNTHLQPSGKVEDVTPEIALYFTDEKPRYFPIVLQLQNDRALDIPAGASDFVVADEFQLPEDADLLAIYPHAHYLGTLLEATAKLPDGKTRELIRIPHWDLNWQAVYRYCFPVHLPKGTSIRMRFHYDNSDSNERNPHHPPKRVQAGNQATDEMGHLWIQLLPCAKGDHRRPFQEAMARHRIARDPGDAAAHLSLGAILLSRLRVQEALPELRIAARLDNALPEAHDMLGAALQNTGQLQEAVLEYRRALAIASNYASAHYNLARALAKLGERESALREMKIVRRAFPEDARIAAEWEEMKAR